jgi:acyl-CoA synthetase (AMP-forming)/AMP-acid ligase II
MIRLDALLARAASSRPERKAVIFESASWTYAQVYDRARRVAGVLSEIGVAQGDRVAFWSSNRPEFVELLFGVPMGGAIFAPLDHWWTPMEMCAALEQIRPKVLIIGPGQADAIAECQQAVAAAGVEHVLCLGNLGATSFRSYASALESARAAHEVAEISSLAPALILFTSGSTGRSKGAVHTHRGLVSTAMTMSVELGLIDDERTLHFLPLFSSCLEHLIPLTLTCATHVILAHFDASAVWEAVQRWQITHLDAVPTTLRRLMEAAPASIPSSLRLVSYASEPMPPSLIAALMERMPDVAFVQFYGMIEHLCLTVLRPWQQHQKAGTVGRPMIGAQIRILDSEGAEAAWGESGEVIAWSPTLFAGYWGADAATSDVMCGDAMRTGDIGRFDQDGFLTLEGRIKELIKSGGLTVIPTEIEDVLLRHPAVRDAAVIGIPDEQWGEAVHAFVTAVPGTSLQEADLELLCKERLASYKRPKRIRIVTELPRTGIGKIARRVVRDQALASSS